MTSAAEYKRRRENNLCSRCQTPVANGTSLCASCHEYNTQRQRQLYAKRKAEGVCFKCGGAVDTEGGRCSKCIHKSLGYRDNKVKKGLCRYCPNERTSHPTICDACFAKRSEPRNKVIEAYGSKCACCGEDEPMFLTLDHKERDGAQHRKTVNSTGGLFFYKWVIENNYPDNVQLMCYNCNMGRERYGGICPHKLAERGITVE